MNYADRAPKARCDSCVFFKDQYLHNLGDTGYPYIYGHCAAGVRPSVYNLYFACDEAYSPIPPEDRARGIDARIALYEKRTQQEASTMSAQNVYIETDEGKVAELFGDVSSRNPKTRQIIDKMALVSSGEAIVIPAESEDEAKAIQSRMSYWALQAGWREEGVKNAYRTRIINGNGEHRVAVLRLK